LIHSRTREPTLLIVEDQRQLRELLRVVVGERGWHVAVAADGLSANEWLSTNRPDAVLLDVGLPGEDGVAIAQQERLRHPGVRVIIMTALGQAEQLAATAGTAFYLDKPFDLRHLVDMLEQVRPTATQVA
jgi:DNA-binding response OmpR family regulator